MPKLVFSDVDGVLTDGSINIGPAGELFKSFNVKDGSAIARWQAEAGHQFVIITSRRSEAVAHRAAELGIEEVHQGVADKMAKIEAIAGRFGIGL